jgi:hypothetical protein
MTAKEMFEELGYEQTINSDYLIEYVAHNRVNGFVYISFDFLSKGYELGFSDDYGQSRPIITTIKEHEAITQQLKELSWI